MAAWPVEEMARHISALVGKIRSDSVNPKAQRGGRLSGGLVIGMLALAGFVLLGFLTMIVLINAGFSFRTMGRIGENLQAVIQMIKEML